MLVTGGPPNFGGGGIPQRIIVNSLHGGIADHGRRIVREDARHRGEVADVAVDDAKEGDDRGLVGGDAVEVAHMIAAYRLGDASEAV